MINNIKSSLLALFAFALCGIASARAAAVGPGQREMKEAIVKLELAKNSLSSNESLETARKLLEKAKQKSSAEAVEALKQVDKAIAASRKNDKKAMQSHIDAAVRDIRVGLKATGR